MTELTFATIVVAICKPLRFFLTAFLAIEPNGYLYNASLYNIES